MAAEYIENPTIVDVFNNVIDSASVGTHFSLCIKVQGRRVKRLQSRKKRSTSSGTDESKKEKKDDGTITLYKKKGMRLTSSSKTSESNSSTEFVVNKSMVQKNDESGKASKSSKSASTKSTSKQEKSIQFQKEMKSKEAAKDIESFLENSSAASESSKSKSSKKKHRKRRKKKKTRPEDQPARSWKLNSPGQSSRSSQRKEVERCSIQLDSGIPVYKKHEEEPYYECLLDVSGYNKNCSNLKKELKVKNSTSACCLRRKVERFSILDDTMNDPSAMKSWKKSSSRGRLEKEKKDSKDDVYENFM